MLFILNFCIRCNIHAFDLPANYFAALYWLIKSHLTCVPVALRGENDGSIAIPEGRIGSLLFRYSLRFWT